ncbi:MAG: hypothetical protein HRT67_01490 [Flavobacteriaceae bacterium]|nr:hypothetical protein [Flavobacteriaceae bacterium]
MKKIFVVLTVLTTLFSCQDNTTFYQSVFQGIKDGNELWKASSYQVSIDENGALTFFGTSNQRELKITIPYVSVGKFRLKHTDAGFATFEAFGSSYSTKNPPASGVQYLYGELDLEAIDYVSKTFTGTFKFNAYNADGTAAVNFIEGKIFKLPLSSGTLSSDSYNCSDAETETANALATFEATDLTDSDAYESDCASYVTALQNQIDYCGSDGITEIIEGLNGCAFPCNYAEDNVVNAKSAYDNATIGNYIQACTNYIAFLNQQIEYCGDEDGAIQAIRDALNCADEDGDGVANTFEDINGDSDFDNDDTDGDLNADYLDTDDDNDGVMTADELMFDADGNPTDTDGDGIYNYLDTDDDGDGIPTSAEDVDGDGDLTNDDTDGDGTPNYLDNDDDGDGVHTSFEDLNNDDDFTNDDTDADMTPNYLDSDDDEDGTPTLDENADPNGDGNPDDAVDTDNDGTPDYLDA